MSAASRAREALRRAEAYRARYLGGCPDWATFRAWQAEMLARWCGPSASFDLRPTRPLMRGERAIPATETHPLDNLLLSS